MKKKISYLMLLILSVTFFTGCSMLTKVEEITGIQNQTESGGSMLYFLNAEGTNLEPQNRVVEGSDVKTLAENALKQMQQTDSADYQSVFPSDLQVQSVIVTGKTVTVDFSEAYESMDAIQEVLLRAGVVKTLVGIEGVDKVLFTMNKAVFKRTSGEAVGAMDASSFVDTANQVINSYLYDALALYFSDLSGKKIRKEVRNVHYADTTTLERVVLEQLISGPNANSLLPVLHSSVKIQNVENVDGVITVSFDENFLNTTLSVNVNPETVVYAIVDSLCDTCNAKKVVIQVDGSDDFKYMDTIDMKGGFERYSDIIQQTE